MTYTEFKNKWLGKPINYDNAYGAQCMDVYRMYVKEVLGFPQSPPVQGAKEVWDTYLPEYFNRIDNTPSGFPEQGDIVIWNISTYGHIAICDRATVADLTCFEQNWKELDGSGVTELRTHNYNNILGWLRPKVIDSDNIMTEDEKRALEAIKLFQVEANHSNLEGAANAAIGAYKDISGLQERIKSLETHLAELSSQALNLSEANKNLTESLDAKQKELEDWQSRFSSANQIINEQIVKFQAVEAQVTFYKKKYQEALISMPKNPSWGDIIHVIKLKLFNL